MEKEKVKLDLSMYNAYPERNSDATSHMDPIYCTLADLAHDIQMMPLSRSALQEFIKEITPRHG